MTRTLAESEALFEQIKNHFLRADQVPFFIEIGPQPMDQWELIFITNYDELEAEVCRQISLNNDFAHFYFYESRYTFHYVDQNIVKTIYVDTNEVAYFKERKPIEFDFEKLLAELKELQGS